MLIDITPVIEPGRTKVWPGDNPPTREVLCRIADGATVDLSTLRTTVHLGAHADAPCHYGDGAPGIDEQPIELYWGPCEVMRVAGRRGERIGVGDLPRTPTSERLLLATGTFDGFEVFNQDFSGLEPALVDHLHAAASVSSASTPRASTFSTTRNCWPTGSSPTTWPSSRDSPREVPEGEYELAALPLKLVGFDGSPIRAGLRSSP